MAVQMEDRKSPKSVKWDLKGNASETISVWLHLSEQTKLTLKKMWIIDLHPL